MPQYQTWEEFSRAAEKLYLADPMKVRVVLKYRHADGNLCIKVTDDSVDSVLGCLFIPLTEQSILKSSTACDCAYLQIPAFSSRFSSDF
ncbi:signal recognition particle 9 kDa protein isoform X1 [Castor canadensis]|uniref:Signal recognition particle 9 kDa protein isoform X1 n=2 Tax=Castor canadensis TaxID=51338 RepID=A0AC58KJ92_CASCN